MRDDGEYLVAGYILSMGEIFETCTLLATLVVLGRYVSVLARLYLLTKGIYCYSCE
jgi:hypothetical protein